MTAAYNPFVPAVQEQSKLRLAISGPTGSGKTFTAIRIAILMLGGKSLADGFGATLDRRDNGLARIAFIDTERGSARKYSNDFPSNIPGQAAFDVLELGRNDQGAVDPIEMTNAIIAAGNAGYEVCVGDSLSHAWEGVLDAKDKKDKATAAKGTNTYTNWREITPLHNKLVDSMLDYPGHFIGCMRVKMETVIEKNPDTGKNEVHKLGLKSVQRDGVEYEFDIVFDMTDQGTVNTASISKSRSSKIKRMVSIDNPGEEVAAALNEWLATGVAVEVPMTREEFVAAMLAAGYTDEVAVGAAIKSLGLTSVSGPRKFNILAEALKNAKSGE